MNVGHDEDLERAIALSLQDSKVSQISAQNGGTAGEDSDEESHFQAQLAAALEASKSETSRPDLGQPASRQVSSEPTSGFLSERAQLERARIERQKRLRREAGLEEETVEDSDRDPPAKRQQLSSSYTLRANNGDSNRVASSLNSSRTSSASRPLESVSTGEQIFWDGELRPTATRHANPRRDGQPTFRLTEVLGNKSEISFAILSSYSLMISWIYEFFEPSTPVIMVAQPDESGNETIKNVLPNWIKTTPFLRNGRGCMHMKFMLLFYNTGRLRVVVSTANLVDFDWRDIENAVWLQDLPMRSSAMSNDTRATSEDFPGMFQRVLRALNVRPALATMLKSDHPNLPLQSIDDLRTKWDWSRAKVHLVPSIAGKSEGWPNIILNGHTRLMKAVRNMGLRTGRGNNTKTVTLECQGSSIGTYSTQWMNEFHYSARGESAEDWLDEPKARRAKLPWPAVKIVFPSKKTVSETVLGEPGGGTVFCRRNQWDGVRFPRDLFHDSKSKAGGVLMHTKMIIATFREPVNPSSFFSKGNGKGKQAAADFDTDNDSDTEEGSDDDVIEIVEISEPKVGWAYVGSHNFTPSAWGTLSGSSFNPSLNVVNYELGVVFPLKDEEQLKRVACFERPARKYEDKDRAWIQQESAVFRDN